MFANPCSVLSRVTWFQLDTGFIDHLHHSELQVITAPLLISTIHKAQQHVLNIFQAAVSSTPVSYRRLLTVEISQIPTLTSLLSGEYPATELLSTLNYIWRNLFPSYTELPTLNCVPGWWPSHTSILIFSSQTPLQRSTDSSQFYSYNSSVRIA
jgi:hypothetical protein